MGKPLIRSMLAASLAVLVFPDTAHGQTIGISPVGVTLPAGQATTTVQVTNRGTEPAAIQVRWFAWSQTSGEDNLVATSELLVSPPLAKIPPGGSQTVRILLKTPARGKESAYRILFDQIPLASVAGGVRVALRISIPVFATPAVPVKSELVWSGRVDPSGAAELIVVNRGLRHARLNQIRVAGGAGALAINGPANLYLLPGSEHHLKLRGAPIVVGTALRINASSDEGDIAASATLQPRL
jgi:fimbrial chaperone protein